MSRKHLISVFILALLVLGLSAGVVFAAISNVAVTFSNTSGSDSNWTAKWTFTADSLLNSDVCLTMNNSTTGCTNVSGNTYTCTRSGLSASTNYNWTLRETLGFGCGAIITTISTQTGSFTITPLAVDLASFTGAVADGRPVLTWETISEQDNAGFNVYRGASEQGPWVKANDSLIPAAAPGSPEGRAYQWSDPNPANQGAPYGAYWYLLEDVDVNGVAAQHGPVQVGLSAPTAVTLQGFTAQPDWAALLREWAALLRVWRSGK